MVVVLVEYFTKHVNPTLHEHFVVVVADLLQQLHQLRDAVAVILCKQQELKLKRFNMNEQQHFSTPDSRRMTDLQGAAEQHDKVLDF